MKEGHFDKTQVIIGLKPNNANTPVDRRPPPATKPTAKTASAFSEFLLQDKSKIWRMWIYRRMFTPYEQDEKFSDETMFENSECSFICIETVHDLPDGDLVLGVRYIYDEVGLNEPESEHIIEYLKFSEIRLEYIASDKKKKF